VAQPLPKPEETTSGLDAAVARLQQAFERLERAAETSRNGHHSLKEDHEKLNHLLHEADGEIGRLREAVYSVTERLDRTIGMLEKESA
jgi:chromosome segregation ATPase